jgi:hypothetical protein
LLLGFTSLPQERNSKPVLNLLPKQMAQNATAWGKEWKNELSIGESGVGAPLS